jgi:1-acyl-sn-glycerol-3-phosphate acyltransferase
MTMKAIAIPAKIVWRTLFFLNFGLTLLLLYPAFFLLLSRREWFPAVMRLKRVWARLILFNVGIRYKINYEDRLRPDQTFVFCPNHTSYLDVILSYLAIPSYFHYIAKIELARAPLFGIFFKRGMDIAFDRKSIKASHQAFHKASLDLDKGISIAMFPEGTISPQAPRLSKFKNGPFKLAIEKQIPIVPITFKNNWLILPDGHVRGGVPGKARVIVHKPIPTAGYSEKDLEKLKQEVYEIIEKELSSHENR